MNRATRFLPRSTELKIDRVAVEIVIGYENVGDLHRIMTEMEVLVEAEEYGERVEFRSAVPVEAFDSFSAAVADATSGSGSARARLDIHLFHGRFDLPESGLTTRMTHATPWQMDDDLSRDDPDRLPGRRHGFARDR